MELRKSFDKDIVWSVFRLDKTFLKQSNSTEI